MKCPLCARTMHRQLNHLYCGQCGIQEWDVYGNHSEEISDLKNEAFEKTVITVRNL